MFAVDDLFFFISKKDINALQKRKKLEGVFASNSNRSDGGIVKMKLSVNIFKPSRKRIFTTADISFDKKETSFYISEDDFNEWFINPTEWIKENGPPIRLASCNVYIKTEYSKNFEFHKQSIDNFIVQAK